jgi:hypothetical protein
MGFTHIDRHHLSRGKVPDIRYFYETRLGHNLYYS